MSTLDRQRAIISDDEIVAVHGDASFGTLSPRYVVNEGVLKSAYGYHHGSTALWILRQHGLVKAHNGRLTKKGFRYLQSLDCYDSAKVALEGEA